MNDQSEQTESVVRMFNDAINNHDIDALFVGFRSFTQGGMVMFAESTLCE